MQLIKHIMESKLINETEIFNLNNSFTSISDGETTIWMDPLKSRSNLGAWAQWSESVSAQNVINQIKLKKIDYIFISHLHSDHFDEFFLKDIFNLDQDCPIIIIKEFRSKRLKEKIIKFWPKDKVIEIPEYQFFNASTIEIVILPQMSPSSEESSGLINYDLDTSCIVRTKDVVIFNEVDNTYSLEEYKFLNSKINELGIEKIDLALIGYSGASDYPQCHLDIDRQSEAKRIKEKCIKRFLEVGKLLNTQYIVPAGGNYLLDYPFDYLNDYICVPSFEDIESYNVSKICSVVNPGRYYFSILDNVISLKKRFDNLPIKPSIGKENPSIPYLYESSNVQILKKSIIENVEILEKNFPQHFLDIYSKLQTSITFIVHKDIPKYSDLEELINRSIYSWKIFKNLESVVKKDISLDVHISGEAFMQMSKGLLSWDELVFHCLFLRKPNIYEPEALMFINWYRNWEKN